MYDRRDYRCNGTRYVNCIWGVIVNDGTAQFSVKTVCAKEYVDAVNTTVTEMKEKYIFRFETFPKAQITRVYAQTISVYSPVPQGYERMAVIAYCNGSPTAFLPDLSVDERKTEKNMQLWIQGLLDENNIDLTFKFMVKLGVFTIFVKKE